MGGFEGGGRGEDEKETVRKSDTRGLRKTHMNHKNTTNASATFAGLSTYIRALVEHAIGRHIKQFGCAVRHGAVLEMKEEMWWMW